MIILICIEKALNKIQQFFMIKTLYKASNKGKIPQHDKMHLKNGQLTSYSVVTEAELPPKMKNETRISIFTIASQHCPGSYSQDKKDQERGREKKQAYK